MNLWLGNNGGIEEKGWMCSGVTEAGDSEVGSGIDEDGGSGGYSPKSVRSAVRGRARFLRFLILCDCCGCCGGGWLPPPPASGRIDHSQPVKALSISALSILASFGNNKGKNKMR